MATAPDAPSTATSSLDDEERSVDRGHLAVLIERERARYATAHPWSRDLFESASHLFGRVPTTWMANWAGGFPAYLDQAYGNRVLDVDGNTYIDFCLGDSVAIAGHSPEPTISMVHERVLVEGGVSTMLSTEDAEAVGAELSRRFGLPLWSFALSEEEANRWALRLARVATGRPRIAVFANAYHGSVDETFALSGPDDEAIARPGTVGPPCDVNLTTRVVEYNDLDSLDAALGKGDVAALLMEPALTNVGIVLPEPGYLAEVRRLCTAHGTLLILDETHTLALGPGGATAAWDLEPDLLTVGKGIGGGFPAAALGLTESVAREVALHREVSLASRGGIGGSLSGNSMSMAAMRATLEQVLTDDAFEGMIGNATAFAQGIREVISSVRLPWSVHQLGARVEYRFMSPAPRTGSESAAGADSLLDEYFHLYMVNRGILISPMHNMALMCPETTRDDVATHTRLFSQAVDDLLADSTR
jgi:glutamate-1-semialdehyde 2,1-aminomutase